MPINTPKANGISDLAITSEPAYLGIVGPRFRDLNLDTFSAEDQDLRSIFRTPHTV